jgi:hypothetical protein
MKNWPARNNCQKKMKPSFLRLAFTASIIFASFMAHADTTPQTGTDTIPEILIADLQAELGLKDFQAAAIVGNLAQETGNFTMLHQIKGPGLGYSQWSGSRKTDFKNFAEDTLSYGDNRDFLVHELTGPYAKVLDRVRRTSSMEEATSVFMKQFLRPSAKHANLPRRVRFARSFMRGDFEGAGCIDHLHLGNGRLATCDKIDRAGT